VQDFYRVINAKAPTEDLRMQTLEAMEDIEWNNGGITTRVVVVTGHTNDVAKILHMIVRR
jgi:hypothetical protein